MINSCSFASSNSEKEFSYSYIHIKYSASRISAVMWRKVHVWFKIRWTSWYFWRTRKLLEAEHTSPQNANHTKQHQLYPTTANLFLCATSSCFHFLNKVFLPRFLATSVMARYHHRCISVGSVNGHGDWDLTDKIKKTLAGEYINCSRILLCSARISVPVFTLSWWTLTWYICTCNCHIYISEI